jgi:hypothetical protein
MVHSKVDSVCANFQHVIASTGSISEFIGNLLNLLELDLQDNKLSGVYPDHAYTFGIHFELCTTVGTIPVELLRMKAKGKSVRLPARLILPENIEDLGEDITRLDLSNMGLAGKV